jgi:phage protein U
MFATFGEIIFEVVSSPERFESTHHWNYAEHRVVESLPLLQWVGDGLATITIAMMFHVSFTNPATQTAALLAAASDHNARALVFGNGDHRGYFVVTAVRIKSRQMASDGSPIATTLEVELKQWPLEATLNSGAPMQPSFTPPGIVPAAAGASSGPIQYSPPSGIATTPASPASTYTPPALAAPGVSSILYNPSQTGAGPSGVLPIDIPATSIVRASS